MHRRHVAARISQFLFLALGFSVVATPAQALFHLMQIEQVIGGLCGDTRQQAVQLRMRFDGQNIVSGKRLVAWDETGSNPVILLTFPSNVSNSAAGSRILVASSELANLHGVAADFAMANPIPADYLDAGRITFEDSGSVYWALAWGGAAFTGSNQGSVLNDADGNFNPPFAGPLPSSSSQSLLFQGSASAQSTNNATDYALTSSPAVLSNNSGVATMLPGCIFFDGFESGDTLRWSASVP